MNRNRQHRAPALQRLPLAQGFTLIECIWAVAIAALLASLSLPLSQGQWQRGQRAQARVALAQAGAWLEREMTLGGAWPSAWPEAAPWVEGLSYRLSFSVEGQGYVLRASPLGRQSSDPCGVLWLTDQGLRGADGPACW
jgi:type IV pilus assembly protein PilE